MTERKDDPHRTTMEQIARDIREGTFPKKSKATLMENSGAPSLLKRPTGSNADEWQLFLQEYLSGPSGRLNDFAFVAVQIAEAIDAGAKARAIVLHSDGQALPTPPQP